MVDLDTKSERQRPADGPDRLSFTDAMRVLRQAQKPGHGVPAYMRWINRPLARPLAAAGYVLHMTPNMITAASAMSSLAGLVILAAVEPGPGVGIAVAVMLAFGFALDSADGQLARLTHTGGPAGEWLDHVVDAIRTPAVHLAVLLVLLGRFGWTPFLVVPTIFCLSAVGHFMSQILAEQLRLQHGGPAVGSIPASPRRSLILLPVDAGTLCWVFVLWGFPPLFAAAYAFLALAQLAFTGVSMRRKYAGLAVLRTQKGETR
ncbi:CDP-alcohol phosphatidyltransferase family protein [Arthrobacter sp. MDB2-24]